jgi:hypothetical protein
MDKSTFFLTMSILGTVFLTAALYLGSTVSPQQAKDMKEGKTDTLNASQNLAISIARFAFMSTILISVFTVVKGILTWLVS